MSRASTKKSKKKRIKANRFSFSTIGCKFQSSSMNDNVDDAVPSFLTTNNYQLENSTVLEKKELQFLESKNGVKFTLYFRFFNVSRKKSATHPPPASYCLLKSDYALHDISYFTILQKKTFFNIYFFFDSRRKK